MRAGQPSHTARGAAAFRALHQALEGGAIFRDPFAEQILDDDTRARIDEIAAHPKQGIGIGPGAHVVRAQR